MSDSSGVLTSIIPTRNRPHFLRMTLQYYKKVGWPYALFIADSSDSKNFEETASLIAAHKKNGTITHQSFPAEMGVHTIWAKVLEGIATPFVITSGDDDFLIPSALARCVEFLKTNPDYTLASGSALRSTVRQKDSGGFEMIDTEAGVFKAVENEKATERLLHYLYPTWAPNTFALQRTPHMLETLQTAVAKGLDVDSLSDFFCECAIDGINVIRGKEKKFNEFLSMVMLKHDQHFYRTKLVGTFKRMTSEHFPKIAATIVEWWTEELMKKDSISRDEAHDVAEAGFMHFICLKGLSGLRHVLARVESHSLRKMLARFSLARKVWHFLKSSRYKTTLPALLSKRSAYHHDFMEVYQVLSASDSTGGRQ